MSDHLNPEPSTPPNTEMPDGKLYDPTGQYARAYARAKYANANLGGFSPLQFSPSPPGQLVLKRSHQSSSQELPPMPINGHQHVPELARPSSTASYGSTMLIPRSNISRDRVVARVISRHYNPSQLGERFHHDPSSAPTSGLPSSRRQHPTSFEQQKIYREPYGPSRQFVPHNRSHPKEGIQAMNDQGHEGYAAGNDQGARDYEAGDVDFESGIFAQDRSAKPAGDSRAPLNPRKRFSQEPLTAYAKRGPARPQAGEESDDEYFNNPGKNLRQSRYSGGQNNWGVNRKPGLVPEDEVTDAALLKRGLKRGDGADVCKRGYGANDPENIAIVNMYEIDRMSFDQISKKLNANRVENGRDPSLSANGVQNRYNRNAPILFQAEGREFVPLSQRKKGQRMDDITPSAGPNSRTPWTDELDVALVKAVKEWESGKWENVAAIFREKTGVDMDAKACALRHHII